MRRDNQGEKLPIQIVALHFRLPVEAVVSTVDVAYRSCADVRVSSFPRGDLDCHDGVSLGIHTFSVGPHAGRRAGMIGQVGLGPARRSSSVTDFGALSWSEGGSGARFAAQRTVARQAALVEIKIDLVTHATAVASALIGARTPIGIVRY